MAESTTGKPKQLTCHCVAPANPLKNNNSLQIKLSSSLSVTGFQVRKLVLWVHSLTLNTCLNKVLHPMDILPIPWLQWIKVLSSWHGCWHSSPICSHLCARYFPERTNLPAPNPTVPRCFQTAQDTLSGTAFTSVQDPRGITWGDQSCAEIPESRRMPQSAVTVGIPTLDSADESWAG